MYIKLHDHCKPAGAYGISPFQHIINLKCSSFSCSHNGLFVAFITHTEEISIWDMSGIPFLVTSLRCNDYGSISNVEFSPDDEHITATATNAQSHSTTLIHWSIYATSPTQIITYVI